MGGIPKVSGLSPGVQTSEWGSRGNLIISPVWAPRCVLLESSTPRNELKLSKPGCAWFLASGPFTRRSNHSRNTQLGTGYSETGKPPLSVLRGRFLPLGSGVTPGTRIRPPEPGAQTKPGRKPRETFSCAPSSRFGGAGPIKGVLRDYPTWGPQIPPPWALSSRLCALAWLLSLSFPTAPWVSRGDPSPLRPAGAAWSGPGHPEGPRLRPDPAPPRPARLPRPGRRRRGRRARGRGARGPHRDAVPWLPPSGAPLRTRSTGSAGPGAPPRAAPHVSSPAPRWPGLPQPGGPPNHHPLQDPPGPSRDPWSRLGGAGGNREATGVPDRRPRGPWRPPISPSRCLGACRETCLEEEARGLLGKRVRKALRAPFLRGIPDPEFEGGPRGPSALPWAQGWMRLGSSHPGPDGDSAEVSCAPGPPAPPSRVPGPAVGVFVCLGWG